MPPPTGSPSERTRLLFVPPARGRYYQDEAQARGRAGAGYVRLGAERPLHEFTAAEQSDIVRAFDAAQAHFECERVGVDVWTAG